MVYHLIMPRVHMLLLFIHIPNVKTNKTLKLFVRLCSLSKNIVKYFIKMMRHPWILPFFVYFHYVKLIVKIHKLRKQMMIFGYFFLKGLWKCFIEFTCCNIYLGRKLCFYDLLCRSTIFFLYLNVYNRLAYICLHLLVFKMTRVYFNEFLK